jgi:hypothetical protein
MVLGYEEEIQLPFFGGIVTNLSSHKPASLTAKNQQSCKNMTRNSRERESQQQYQQETRLVKPPPPPSLLKQPPIYSLQVSIQQHDDDLLEIYNRAMQALDAADNDEHVMEVYMNAMSILKSQQEEQHGETLPRSVMDIKRNSRNWDVYALEGFE